MFTLITRRNLVLTGMAAAATLVWPARSSKATSTTRVEIEKVVHAWVNAYQNISKPELMISLFSDDIFFEDPTFRLRSQGIEKMRKFVHQNAAGFENVKVEPALILIDPPWAALQCTVSGLMKQEAGPSRQIHVRGTTFLMVENGKIKKWNDYYDYRTFTEQLGGSIHE